MGLLMTATALALPLSGCEEADQGSARPVGMPAVGRRGGPLGRPAPRPGARGGGGAASARRSQASPAAR